jgi:hypothetical protein
MLVAISAFRAQLTTVSMVARLALAASAHLKDALDFGLPARAQAFTNGRSQSDGDR